MELSFAGKIMTVNEPWLYHGYVSHNQEVIVDLLLPSGKLT